MKLARSWWNPHKSVWDVPSAGWFANMCWGTGVFLIVGLAGYMVVSATSGKPLAWSLGFPLLGIGCLLIYACRRLMEISGFLNLLGTLVVCIGRRQRLEGLFSEDDIDAMRGMLGLDAPPEGGSQMGNTRGEFGTGSGLNR